MSAILLVLAEVVVVYLVNFNGSYFAAISYKDSFPLKEQSKTLNGFFLWIFVAVSNLGNLLYRGIRLIGNYCAEALAKKLHNDKLRRLLNEVIDICLYFVFLFILNKAHGYFTDWGDMDLADNLWGKFLGSNVYTALLYHTTQSREYGRWLVAFIFFVLMVLEQFLYYTIIFGFLDSRMRQTGVSKIISSRKFKNDDDVGNKVQEKTLLGAHKAVKEGLDGEKVSDIIFDGLKSVVTTVRDGVSHVLWLFVGFYKVSVAVVTLCVMSLIVVILRAMGVLNFTASSMLSEVISWSDITSIVFNVIFTVVIVKVVQVVIVQTPLKLIAPAAYDNICDKADGIGKEAKAVLEERHSEAEKLDNIRIIVDNDNPTLCSAESEMLYYEEKRKREKERRKWERNYGKEYTKQYYNHDTAHTSNATSYTSSSGERLSDTLDRLGKDLERDLGNNLKK